MMMLTAHHCGDLVTIGQQDLVYFFGGALVLRDVASNSAPQSVPWMLLVLLLGMTIAVVWSPLWALIFVPPVSHVIFAARKHAAMFEPFGGGRWFAVLQGFGWSAYSTLVMDIILLASCALPMNSHLARTFGLPTNLGPLAAAAHVCLLSSFAFRKKNDDQTLAQQLAGVGALLLAAFAVGLALCLDIDSDETRRIFHVVHLDLSTAHLRLISIAAGVLAPIVYLAALPSIISKDLAAVVIWLLGADAAYSFHHVTPAAILFLTSLLVPLVSRRLASKPPVSTTDIIGLYVALAAANNNVDPWPAHLTKAILDFLHSEESSSSSSSSRIIGRRRRRGRRRGYDS